MPKTAPTRNLPIPRSAPLTDAITATSKKTGNTITVQRFGPLTRGGEAIEWARWTVTYPDETRESWAKQYTGANLARLTAELDETERDLAADPDVINLTRTTGAKP
ncbi:hypothetical protein KDK95_30985 [Actinospica sp. MGRD01-02]|uniref:Uncharacterized protein n=1 Tax=Actinospica acidithermotolerans TaxID=2828514 RepID=A0A941EKI1_9ACTN|nr:hypothetical protein [Actinospica acidithermotolerans]MBR7830769.1 hypothetical protein [Actinospica acidithermotolerans]